MGALSVPQGKRVDWVDCAKGICICFVVMMHSTLGVEDAVGHIGFMHTVVAFAKPFRMPDFFLISGLFLADVIDRDWRTYLDRKVVHFAYFYVLWMTIQFFVKLPLIESVQGPEGALQLYMLSFIEPFGTLWFIYLLPIFFVATKLTRRVPPAIIWLVAAALETARIATGWTVIDEFASRFIYFYTGYLFAPPIFRMIADAAKKPQVALACLAIWGGCNWRLVTEGYSEFPLVSLVLGMAGAAAVMTVAGLISRLRLAAPLRYCGKHSIVIYLAFFLPMVITRSLLIRYDLIADAGWMSVIVTLAGIVGSLVIWWAARYSGLYFLFERPASFWIAERPQAVMVPAE